MININEKQKSSKFRERANSKIMFVFPLIKKLAQNMGTSYSGFGKTPKSKTCKRILREIYNKRVLHWKNLCNRGGNKYSNLMFVKLFSLCIQTPDMMKKGGFSLLYFTLH